MGGFTKLSNVLKKSEGTLFFYCPGCQYLHGVNTVNNGSPCWSWNGNVDAPTFAPSILVRTGRAVDPNHVPESDDIPEVCHSFVKDGQIQFLSDCSHKLAGMTVPLPFLPDNH